MNQVNDREQLQLQLMQFLYGELNDAERNQFEQQLQGNPLLQEMLDEEQRFDSMLPPGAKPLLDADRLQGNRWLLQQNLQRQQRQSFSLRAWLQSLAQKPFTVAFQGVAMAATFVLGILIASPPAGDFAGGNRLDAAGESTPLAFIGNDDYEIYQLQVNAYDAASGNIDLSFSLASETRVAGNIADQKIHRLMAAALQHDIDSASRLDTINALQPVSAGSDVYEALIYVLKNDQNPGVRYQAVQSLASLASVERVRDALRDALSEDVNPGIRVEAFQALASYTDAETLAVFRRQMESDSNEYIRSEARHIVEGTGNGAIEL